MKVGYLTPLRVENVDAKNWDILEDFCWQGSKGDIFTVTKGERTDFATTPWWTQAILPKTGTWTKAAVLHDKMCNLLNEFHKLVRHRERLISAGIDPKELEPIFPPTFTSVDTDAIFRLNARKDGTDRIRAELLWFGVRCGALANPARRDRWVSTFWRWFLDLVVILSILVIIALVIIRPW